MPSRNPNPFLLSSSSNNPAHPGGDIELPQDEVEDYWNDDDEGGIDTTGANDYAPTSQPTRHRPPHPHGNNGGGHPMRAGGSKGYIPANNAHGVIPLSRDDRDQYRGGGNGGWCTRWVIWASAILGFCILVVVLVGRPSHLDGPVNLTKDDVPTEGLSPIQGKPCKVDDGDGTTPKQQKKLKLPKYDPFHGEGDWYGSVFVSPPYPDGASAAAETEGETGMQLGYLQHPNVRNGTLVFCTEGDLYLAYLPEGFVQEAKRRGLEGEEGGDDGTKKGKRDFTKAKEKKKKEDEAAGGGGGGGDDADGADESPPDADETDAAAGGDETDDEEENNEDEEDEDDQDPDDETEEEDPDEEEADVATTTTAPPPPAAKTVKANKQAIPPPPTTQPRGPIVSAMRLTTTTGNVLTPHLSPSGDLVAFTATYTGNRELYIMDLNRRHRAPAVRITYLDSTYGVQSVVGWVDGGDAVLIGAVSTNVSLPDSRLYKVYIKRQDATEDKEENTDSSNKNNMLTSSTVPSIGEIVPIPLSQAIDAAIDPSTDCIYFVRNKQTSSTARYVGGTAENIWAYCPDEQVAKPLTKDYRGTSKSPQIWNFPDLLGVPFLLFLSDRSSTTTTASGGDGSAVPATTMNLFAMPLPTHDDLYDQPMAKTGDLIQLTAISCENDGMPLSKYSIDPVRGDIILRVGADFSTVSAADVAMALSKSKKSALAEPAQSHPFTVAVYSDFYLQQERLVPAKIPENLKFLDVFKTSYGQTNALLTLRGQAFVAPVIADTTGAPDATKPYSGAGQNIPPRRYRLAPGGTVGGMVRVLVAKVVPTLDDKTSLCILLATDPLSPTAEHALYLVDCRASAVPAFLSTEELPTPIIGGHLESGGSVKDGGLGSIKADTFEVSPCGRRVAWVDTDGRIVSMTIPADYDPANSTSTETPDIAVLKDKNDMGSPIVGDSDVKWSPGGRYLAITHSAQNQFSIISVADLGDPADEKIVLGDVVQATPDRFNSMSPLWGRASMDYVAPGVEGATVLYFLSDRDVVLTDVSSPWGTRAPSPYFPKRYLLHALPLPFVKEEDDEGNETEDDWSTVGHYLGGGASELVEAVSDETATVNGTDETNNTKADNSTADDATNATAALTDPKPLGDKEIDFGVKGNLMEFARRAYRVNGVPPANYVGLVCQLVDDPSFVMIEKTDTKFVVKVFSVDSWPSDIIEAVEVPTVATSILQAYGMSTSMKHMYFSFSGKLKVVPAELTKVAAMLKDTELKEGIVDTQDLFLTVQPRLEYQQMYNDAWRMLRDYFYDSEMHQLDWPEIHARYHPLVSRCSKREELDDVLKLMASELSALHVFVYGGEYEDPMHGSLDLIKINLVASLGASLRRSTEHNGYVVETVYETDPDFGVVDNLPVYSPLSNKTLALSGQKGLQSGDVILGINGESVLSVPDIGYLLRGLAGRSVRLDVIRRAKPVQNVQNRKAEEEEGDEDKQDALIVVPIAREKAGDLRYSAWEWSTRQSALKLAEEAGFTVGYVHLRSMSGPSATDAFVRGFFPDYNKDALIVDVRHNRGGNIDSWLLDILQRTAWTYWQGRSSNITNGGLGWDEMFAFRGHLVVLIDEHTSSDGEGFSRGVSELELGKLVGTRTWGGGIWLSSDNHLVDGGIATAPEIGTYNNKFGWGMGIEQMGVEPDIEVDNDPRETFDGRDEQLERAIYELKNWMKSEPIVLPKKPGPHPDMSLKMENCPAR